jgi:hypothetical protein
MDNAQKAARFKIVRLEERIAPGVMGGYGGCDNDKGSHKGSHKNSKKGSNKGSKKGSNKGSKKGSNKGSKKGSVKGSKKGGNCPPKPCMPKPCGY